MHPVPIVYGMTIGEYAMMINGEAWLDQQLNCNLWVIPCINYTHETSYKLPIAPSPNLKSELAIALYPSLCLFEATTVSVGRGTNTPFEVYGHPNFPKNYFSFTPISKVGAKNPPQINRLCYGFDLSKNQIERPNQLNLDYLIQARDFWGILFYLLITLIFSIFYLEILTYKINCLKVGLLEKYGKLGSQAWINF